MKKKNLFRLPALIAGLGVMLASAGSALAGVHYVDVNSTNATPPYTNWTTAATNIQDAVDAAVAGDEIVVTNGNYGSLGRAIYGAYNSVVVDKPLIVRSVNGPHFTTIYGVLGRCVYLTNSASLSGFTLTNGVSYDFGGGGVWCASTNAVVTNCVITGNATVNYFGGPGGAGAYGGTLNNCTLSRNSVSFYFQGGGVPSQVFAYGGGAAYCTLNNCTVTGNSANVSIYMAGYTFNANAVAHGGGAYYCTLNNCTVSGNSANVLINGSSTGTVFAYGGGAYYCTLNNCTFSSNSVTATNNYFLTYAGSGGANSSTLNNCIMFLNKASTYEGLYRLICEDCGSPGSLVGNNWFGNPLFVNQLPGNLRLQPNSPCINAGNNSYVTNATDLDGNPRIAGGTVDIGAYEFQAPASMISYAWLQQFNLPINPATDAADPDGDGVNNYREWLAGTDPTNPFSFQPLLTLIPYGANVILTWPTNAVGFTLQSTSNLGSPAVWSTNSPAPVVIGGQNVIINPIPGPQQFFRLGQ